MINDIKKLQKLSAEARHAIVDSLICAGCGHPGGAFSSLDIMTVLFFNTLKIDPSNPKWDKRDRFILSKGHSSVALYSVMHLRGFFDRKTLLTFRQDNSILGGHPDMHKVPGVEMSTGSLGHGLSVGVGMALAAKLDKKRYRTFVLLGDGETQEGSIWEAAMSASHYKLDNLTAIVDRNRIQIDGFTEDVMSLEPYAAKWKAFGWAVKTIDGHDIHEIAATLKEIPFKERKPSLIIADTVKGKGISFMENNPEWHGKALKGDHAEIAKKEVCLKLKEHGKAINENRVRQVPGRARREK
ncbi:MAG: transketolase [Nitrospirae bacterium]|nr:transketolase [Nitrospirota bacterium]